MKKLALSLLLLSSTAFAEAKLAFEAKDAKTKDKAIAIMKKEAPNHQAALDKAAGDKAVTVTISLLKLEQTADTTSCKFGILVGVPGNAMAASIQGGAAAKSIGDQGMDDCISATLADLLDKKVAPTIADHLANHTKPAK